MSSATHPGQSRRRIVSADFVLSAHGLEQIAAFTRPEAAFVGRSNVGKSTLLNRVCGRKDLARVSKTPGRTQALNYFEIEFVTEHSSGPDQPLERSSKQEAHFVDLPGYGFAKVPKAIRSTWDALLADYLTQRELLKVVVLLVDSRREPGAEEHWFSNTIGPERLIVVLTKTDKCNQQELARSRKTVCDFFRIEREALLETGLYAGKPEGIAEVADAVCARLI